MAAQTHIHDLPDVILSNILSSIHDTRARNAISLVCHKWLSIERATRHSLALRANTLDIVMLPSCFHSVTHLDLSLLSPWGHSLFLDSPPNSDLLARFLHRSFPSVTSLTVYSRTPLVLYLLVSQWKGLSHAKLVRWHQRAQAPVGSDFFPLFENCESLKSLDLSNFYCWTEDLPAALDAHPSVAASLTHLNLLTVPSAEGYKSHEIMAITSACPNLCELLVGCMFDPSYIDFVGDEALSAIGLNCPRLVHLQLVDSSSLLNTRGDVDNEGYTSEDARISQATLGELFSRLPLLEILVLDVCHNVRDSGAVLETLNSKCPRLKSLKLGQFHGICRPMDTRIEGIAVCKGLESLSIKNSADLTDAGLMAIALGCPRLTKFHIQGCKLITEMGIKNLTCVLRKTLVEVEISCCRYLPAVSALRAMEPIKHRIQRLHIDCIWDVVEPIHHFDLNGFDKEAGVSKQFTESHVPIATKRSAYFCDANMNKKGRYSSELQSNSNGSLCKSWERLQYLSLWVAVGELLTPLDTMGLEVCPLLEEIQIKVEGDCRSRSKPRQQPFGLICLARYPQLSKMKIDCGEVTGYALTAPSGQVDLSFWERFYLHGIGHLNLNELDYWPPQDRDVNQRGLSHTAAGVIAECTTLRKLFVHGTAHEHSLRTLLKIPNLREMQLREDYYPAPEDDMSTEMRATSCRRFEDALNRREIPD